jgi:multidrug efflux pump subunit AcrA (membrane-fusion protein)
VSSRYGWTGSDRWLPFGARLALLGPLLAACGESEQTPAAAPPPPAVSVVEVEPQDVTPSAQFVGRVVAIDQVDVRARVQGFLEQRLFIEGDDVETGDLLFVRQQPPVQAQVAQANSDVARTGASLAEANAGLGRVQQAVKSGAVSKQELDQDTAKAEEVQVEVLVAWTTASVYPILAHHANESCAKQRIGCADTSRLITGRVSGTGAASRPRAAGPL